MKNLKLFFRKVEIFYAFLFASLLLITTSCNKISESVNSSPNAQVNQSLTFKKTNASNSKSFYSWVLAVGVKNTPGGGAITITCNLAPKPADGQVHYELNVNGFIYELYNNTITIAVQPSTTYTIHADAFNYTSTGENYLASGDASIKTKAGTGTGTNPGCPKGTSLIVFPLDTSTMANRAGWTYIQYDWGTAPGTTSKTPGSVQLRFRATGSSTWLYGQVFHYSFGTTSPNHFFITDLIPGQTYQVQLGVDCNSGVVPVEADFTGNEIYSLTAGPE